MLSKCIMSGLTVEGILRAPAVEAFITVATPAVPEKVPAVGIPVAVNSSWNLPAAEVAPLEDAFWNIAFLLFPEEIEEIIESNEVMVIVNPLKRKWRKWRIGAALDC